MEISLKDSLHETIENSSVPMKRLADELGISYSYLANAANPNLEDFNFQLRHLMPLIKATGSYAVLDYLENACGRVAFALPAAGLDHVEITAGLLDLIGKVGMLSTEISSIVADGKVEQHEWKRVEPVYFELLRLTAQLMASTAQVVR